MVGEGERTRQIGGGCGNSIDARAEYQSSQITTCNYCRARQAAFRIEGSGEIFLSLQRDRISQIYCTGDGAST